MTHCLNVMEIDRLHEACLKRIKLWQKLKSDWVKTV